MELLAGRVALDLATPGAREGTASARPGLLPLRRRPAGDELVLAGRVSDAAAPGSRAT